MPNPLSRRQLIKLISLGTPFLAGCGLARIDPMHVLIRSDRFDSLDDEAQVLKRGGLYWSEDGRIRVLLVQGDAYERGYQHGKLLRAEVQENLGYMHKQMLKKFKSEELFDEAYERMRPFIPDESLQEMHGLAHGSRLPLRTIHHIHALPEISEWGGKKRLKGLVKEMMDGTLGTSCSNLSANFSATSDGRQYVVRILDWGLHRISRLHEFPLLCVHRPDRGHAFVNVGWIGFVGAVSGMNDQGITLGEMGYGDPEGETLRGKPMPFLLREVLQSAANLADVRSLISGSAGTASFVYLMSDGKSGEAELYVRDRSRFQVYKPGDLVEDGSEIVPPIKDTVYGGHYNEKMTELLSAEHGRLSPESLMREIIPQIAMKSNFQNVIYDPKALRLWVSNAKNAESRAAEQSYTAFNLAEFLKTHA
ncbi:MAG: hypothetical protein DCC75_06045 [Proteobacteria bacterium]|nr:MAG: hypothetical protein DCC75_06045 [Pseudomonadota bacterium]